MFYLGLDLGKRVDHTALVVVERLERPRAYQAPEYEGLAVRHLERAPLGTPYPVVVNGIRELLRDEELRGRTVLVVDATGVGAPVVEILRSAGLGCEIAAVTITNGARASQAGPQEWNVPKLDLMAGVQTLLESGELRIARELEDAGALVRELMDVRMAHRDSGSLRVGADRSGEHDDLVIALALACWRGKRVTPKIGFGGGRLF